MTGREIRLIREAKSGNKAAFGKIVRAYQDRILYLGYDLMGNYEDAKDLAQEAFIRAFEKLAQFEERSKFSTWLYRITVNLAMDIHRKNRKKQYVPLENHTRTGSEIDSLLTTDVPGGTSVELEETRAQIDKALDTLSVNQKTAIVLKYFQYKSPKEIAEMMGCTQGTVRNHIFRAMHKLKKTLKTTV